MAIDKPQVALIMGSYSDFPNAFGYYLISSHVYPPFYVL